MIFRFKHFGLATPFKRMMIKADTADTAYSASTKKFSK